MQTDGSHFARKYFAQLKILFLSTSRAWALLKACAVSNRAVSQRTPLESMKPSHLHPYRKSHLANVLWKGTSIVPHVDVSLLRKVFVLITAVFNGNSFLRVDKSCFGTWGGTGLSLLDQGFQRLRVPDKNALRQLTPPNLAQNEHMDHGREKEWPGSIYGWHPFPFPTLDFPFPVWKWKQWCWPWLERALKSADEKW